MSAIGDQLARAVPGNGIFHAGGLVVIVNRLPDFFRLALLTSVETADDALEFREFLDQFGGEVGFQEMRGTNSARHPRQVP